MSGFKASVGHLFYGILLVLFLQNSEAVQADMLSIPTGAYKPLFKSSTGSEKTIVKAFQIDRYPVTNIQYQQFILQNPKWSRVNIKPVFSDRNYLKHFDKQTGMELIAHQPVTNISWFSARAYCKALSKRLPRQDEWEYVASASQFSTDGSSDPQYRQLILDWYAQSAGAELPNVEDTLPNFWQVHGLHGVVWELVDDFNSALISGESRGDSQLEQQLFCGAGAASSADPGDYAAFMRYALRSSYQASYTMESLGFRCARDLVKE